MKKIPYGIANFEAIKENNEYYFVDKTKYIEEIENLGGKFLFFLRPRRFGKSLFLSMLEHYYDPNRASQFDELFGDTYIGKNPTRLKNTLPIFKLNFSGLPTDKGSTEIEEGFYLRIKRMIDLFYSFYPVTGGEKQFKKDFKNVTNATSLISEFISLMYKRNIKYYLLIDEYDNFANNILIHYGEKKYEDITHKSGFLRSFFAAIKNGTESRTIERMFVTGVSPLVLSDVTSGMNIGDNISNMSLFNSMIGFTKDEVDTMLDYYISKKVVKDNEKNIIKKIFSEYYNNYCFSDNIIEKVHNSDMILYFFNKYFQDKKIPNSLIDENIRIDFGKLEFLIMQDKKLNGNFSILADLIEKKELDTKLVHSFALNEIIEENKFKSFLYYLGLLTIKEYVYGNEYILNIPNAVIATMHHDYIRRSLKDSFELNIDISFLNKAFKDLAFEGKWEPIFKHILDKFYEAKDLRDFITKEHGIKMFMLAYLNITPLYSIESEAQLNDGFADIFFRKNYYITDLTKYEYLIELKYLKETKKEETKVKNKKKLREDAIKQLNRYEKTRYISCKLKKIIIILSSKGIELMEEI